MDTSKGWIIQVDGKGQVVAATPLPQDGVLTASAPQVVQVSRDEHVVSAQPIAREQSEGRSAGWIPLFLTGAIALSVAGFIVDKLVGLVQEQQRQLELERTEQKGFERGLQFQSSAEAQFYALVSNSNPCESQHRSSGRLCNLAEQRSAA